VKSSPTLSHILCPAQHHTPQTLLCSKLHKRTVTSPFLRPSKHLDHLFLQLNIYNYIKTLSFLIHKNFNVSNSFNFNLFKSLEFIVKMPNLRRLNVSFLQIIIFIFIYIYIYIYEEFRCKSL